MKPTFAEAIRQAEEEQLSEACAALRLGREERGYVLARHRRLFWLLDLVLVLGGGHGDYVRMILEARPPLALRW